MTTELILFIFFTLVAVVSSVMVITKRNPIISALFLILNFGALAGIYLLLNAQFIAVVQVIVYAGAIMVLFLFVIMLLKPEHEKRFFELNPKMKYLSLIIGALIFLQTCYILLSGNPQNGTPRDLQKSIEVGTVERIGTELYTTYVLPFEAVGFLLLAAAIGALVLAKKKFD